MLNPRPVPPVGASGARQNRSNTWGRSSARKPGPSSSTRMCPTCRYRRPPGPAPWTRPARVGGHCRPGSSRAGAAGPGLRRWDGVRIHFDPNPGSVRRRLEPVGGVECHGRQIRRLERELHDTRIRPSQEQEIVDQRAHPVHFGLDVVERVAHLGRPGWPRCAADPRPSLERPPGGSEARATRRPRTRAGGASHRGSARGHDPRRPSPSARDATRTASPPASRTVSSVVSVRNSAARSPTTWMTYDALRADERRREHADRCATQLGDHHRLLARPGQLEARALGQGDGHRSRSRVPASPAERRRGPDHGDRA